MSTEQKVALVTGASSGIGEAIAIRLGDQGWRVAIVARRGPRLETLARSIDKTEGPGMAYMIQADLTQKSSPAYVMERTVKMFGGLDLLVNNAGTGAFGMANEVTDEDYEKQYRLNVWAPMALVREGVPILKSGGGGQIVNIGSVVGYVGLPNASIYTSSKWALRGLNETWREELYKYDIKVAYIAPGYTMTEFGPRDPEMAEWALSAEDVAHAVMCVVDQGPNSDIKEIIVQVLDRR